MSSISEEQVLDILKSVKYPGFSRDIVSFGLVRNIQVLDREVVVQLALTTNEKGIPQQIKEQATQALLAHPEIERASVKIDLQSPVQAQGFSATKIDGVKHVIAVASGKGGVGKSTVAANLAVALQKSGAATGLCDCDIYGPSIALMFGANERPVADDNDRILPIERQGLKLMSMGFFLEDDSPAVLRGPMVSRYTQQFLRQVAWDGLDYLVLDLPPGTGDIQLTIVQTVSLSGAVVVTTPQEVALIDARKAVGMFEKTGVPVLGIIENMSYFLCPSDGKHYDIFGTGGGEREAARLGVPLLAKVPIEIALRESGDMGVPYCALPGETPAAEAFHAAAAQIRQGLEK